ncbi:GNAT family N-acetyltransferase [uncultured Litoreibacter sp.]|uniref:GNAT family N-acetyltransferase n=1 Tax=uncultured Litoreibacter sp. TaxID=1392394 RepID=UPI0026226D59|nr:GNAT family N-acetyltransferase [uncultured Litoreibacter sp.]
MSEVTKTLDGGHGRYSLPTDKGEAVMTFSITSPTLVIVDHTEVPIGAEGQGHAGQLARFLVEDARAGGFQVVPLCPFLNMWRRKHPEATDIFQV